MRTRAFVLSDQLFERDGQQPADSVEKLASEALTILEANTKLAENPQ
jgi:hypothetical protein